VAYAACGSPENGEYSNAYNKLLMAVYSPVAALNRSYAYSRVLEGRGYPEAEGLGWRELFYHSLLGIV